MIFFADKLKFFFYVMCPLVKLSIKSLYNCLPFVALNKSCLFVISHKLLFCQKFPQARPGGYVSFYIVSLVSNCPISIKLSKPSFFITWNIFSNCIFLLLSISLLYVLFFLQKHLRCLHIGFMIFSASSVESILHL